MLGAPEVEIPVVDYIMQERDTEKKIFFRAEHVIPFTWYSRRDFGSMISKILRSSPRRELTTLWHAQQQIGLSSD